MTPGPSPAPRSVVFDLGGVLIDWNPRYLYRKLFPGDETGMEHFLSTVCTPAWNEQQDAGRPVAVAVAELLGRYPEQEPLIRAYYSRFNETLRGEISGTVRLLEALDLAGIPLYALSNWSAETFPVARARFGFLSRFRDIVVSGEIGTKKPDPAIFGVLLERNRLTSQACVFIDDSPKNVTAAQALGFAAIHFRSPEQLALELERFGLLHAPAVKH